MKQIKVIHHSRDLDGWCSGKILELFMKSKFSEFAELEVIGYHYNEPFDLLTLTGCDVYMADISMTVEAIDTIAKIANSFTWIDHHQSKIKEMLHQSKMWGKVTHVLPESDTQKISACELCWKYCFPSSPVPETVRLLGAYDSWRNENKGEWDNKILPFQYYMQSIVNSVDTFPNEMFNQSYPLYECFEKGKSILAYLDKQNERAVKGGAFNAIIGGYSAVCLNGSGNPSNTFKNSLLCYETDIQVLFSMSGNGTWNVSLRSINGTDVAAIAKMYGGGGHNAAAGVSFKDFAALKSFLNI